MRAWLKWTVKQHLVVRCFRFSAFDLSDQSPLACRGVMYFREFITDKRHQSSWSCYCCRPFEVFTPSMPRPLVMLKLGIRSPPATKTHSFE